MSKMTCSQLSIWMLIAIALQIIGLSLFVIGFFPVKPALSGVSGPESYRSPMADFEEDFNVTSMAPDNLRSLYQELSQLPASYDRLILMVIDGLPAEFVLGKDGQPPPKDFMDAMPYTQSLLSKGMAVGYHAKAAPPTVTMPRLKALVSGAIGGFLDVVSNFNTQALLDDNLLGQFIRIGWKMVMLGDETWIKLFPESFSRQDGVSSFFVKDTIQVDHNVSRHLPEELNQNDWHLMILHYLGLDHVGHTGGRKSVLMVPKLKEMDEVIKMIHLNSILPHDEDKERTLLVIVSDHGMTDSGNHGGSSFEETDSLALFIGPHTRLSGYTSAIDNNANQVDITPTLAVLFGVPIPRNNVGVLITETLGSLTDDLKLRALELNSWQLYRLLRAQLPHLSCSSPSSDAHGSHQFSSISCSEVALEEEFCCLYSQAAVLHNAWKSNTISGSNLDIYNHTITAYCTFLTAASEWLSRRVVDKPMGQLALGIVAMLLSCWVFLSLLFCLRREDYVGQIWNSKDLKKNVQEWSLEEIFVLSCVGILMLSMGSSSMVEEEQYIWHFLTATLFLVLLRKRIQYHSFAAQCSFHNQHDDGNSFDIIYIIILLLSARFMRGWHQGGVNWSHFPDMSKWLEQSGSNWIKFIQVVAVSFVISLGLLTFSRSKLNRNFILLVKLLFLGSALLVLQHVTIYQTDMVASAHHGATLMAQVIYVVLLLLTSATVLGSPWLATTFISEELSTASDQLSASQWLMRRVKASLYLTGLAFLLCWSLLQLLLQQPVNSMPVFLLLLQIWISIIYFGNNQIRYKQWIEVATLYFLGMAGHFGFGNTNTLATIDVAGAFIGISSHSTFLSGVLMFSITYASPMMVLLSLMIYNSVKETRFPGNCPNVDMDHLLKTMIGMLCLVTLGLNSVLLTAYTFILLQMRNHLFIWSVFSPKYLYVCATTACIYIGLSIVVTAELYIFWVCNKKRREIKLFKTSNSKALVEQ